MAPLRFAASLHHLRALTAQDNLIRSDGDLLGDFVAGRDATAFTILVKRHGSLVLGVCRRELSSTEDAEDAFQATFLLLAQKAGTIRKGASLASWLHGVAFRMARNARRAAARRRRHEGKVLPMQAKSSAQDVAWREAQALIDAEVQALPGSYRAPFILRFLDGRSTADAAAELGLTPKAFERRLARARALLQKRLARRGVSLSAILAALAVATETKAAAVPSLLLSSTVGLAQEFSTHGTAPVQITSLLHKVTTEMFIKKLKLFAVCFITLTFVAGGTALFTRRADTDRLTAASATSASREAYPDSSFASSRSLARQAPVPVADKDDSKEKPIDKPAWKVGAKGCSPRYAHSAVWDPKHEKMIVFGGSIRKGDSFDYYNDVWTYSPAKDEWKEVEVKDKTKPDERAYQACAWDSKRNQMWIYGGGNSNFEGWTDLWMFDPEAVKWTSVDCGDTHPRGRLGATLHYYPPTDSLILIGGSEGFTGNEAAVHEVWFYSIKDKKWTEKKNNAPHRWLAATALDPKNGLIILFSGIDGKSQVHDETYVYDIDKDKWSDAVKGKRITNSLPAVWDSEHARIIVCAGTCPGVDTTAYDDVFTFDPQKKEWKELTVEGDKPEPRAYHSAIWVPELHTMFVFGGTTNQFSDPSVENKVWTLRLPAK